MWRELKTLSHFKLPVICSKGACIVLQTAGEEGEKGGSREGEEAEVESLLAALGCGARQTELCRSRSAFVFFLMPSFSATSFPSASGGATLRYSAPRRCDNLSRVGRRRGGGAVDNARGERTRDYRYENTGLKRAT